MPATMLQGDIGLLYKKDDRDDPRNYRPITLLQNAYKIYTRALTRRMREVVHQFVSEAQKGFVPKTFIADCTMLLNLIENYINEEPESRKGLFVFLDMEKAFDRCSYEYLMKALEETGFGPRFRSMVKLMYNVDNPPMRRIYANGYYSGWFPIKSGVAQGCPLSPLLFLLVACALPPKPLDPGRNPHNRTATKRETACMQRKLCMHETVPTRSESVSHWSVVRVSGQHHISACLVFTQDLPCRLLRHLRRHLRPARRAGTQGHPRRATQPSGATRQVRAW